MTLTRRLATGARMGEFFALLSAACFATANVTITRGSTSSDADNGAFLSILLTAAAACVAMLVSSGIPTVESLSIRGLAWFALGGVLTAFVGRVFLFASVQSLGAMRASAVKRLNPFFAVIIGVLVLGDSLGGWMLPGMILIFASFVFLARESWRTSAVVVTPYANVATLSSRMFKLGLVYGPVSAFAYALGYLARKAGLAYIPDPFIGAFVGALAGIAAYLSASLAIPAYRKAIGNAFTRINPWFYFTGMLASFGQIFYFVALNESTVSRVALISSVEVFITIFLSLWIFRSGERLTATTLLAACLGVAGTALILLR
jgi:drug/metabolite transporter (DMT)-like permease